MSVGSVFEQICSEGVCIQRLAACKNLISMKQAILHRKVFCRLLEDSSIGQLSGQYHDLDEIVFYYFMPKKEAQALHRCIQKHHNPDCFEYMVCVEKILDWEVAHRIRPDHPLSACEMVRSKPEQARFLEPVLRDLGLHESGAECLDFKQFQKQLNSIALAEVKDVINAGIEYLGAIVTVA